MDALALDHVQITVHPADEAACLDFYRNVLRLREIPKPEALRARGGGWFQIGDVQIHVSNEEMLPRTNDRSKRHICFRTRDLEAMERHLRAAGVEIIPDNQPTPEGVRFYIRDPGGNRIEISQPRVQA